MEQLINSLLSGELNTTSLLLLFIIGLLTKRFVPWWVHEAALKKLEQYEQSAPELLDEITTLIDILNEPEVHEVLQHKRLEDKPIRVQQKSRDLQRIVRKQQRRHPRVERGGHTQ